MWRCSGHNPERNRRLPSAGSRAPAATPSPPSVAGRSPPATGPVPQPDSRRPRGARAVPGTRFPWVPTVRPGPSSATTLVTTAETFCRPARSRARPDATAPAVTTSASTPLIHAMTTTHVSTTTTPPERVAPQAPPPHRHTTCPHHRRHPLARGVTAPNTSVLRPGIRAPKGGCHAPPACGAAGRPATSRGPRNVRRQDAGAAVSGHRGVGAGPVSG